MSHQHLCAITLDGITPAVSPFSLVFAIAEHPDIDHVEATDLDLDAETLTLTFGCTPLDLDPEGDWGDAMREVCARHGLYLDLDAVLGDALDLSGWAAEPLDVAV